MDATTERLQSTIDQLGMSSEIFSKVAGISSARLSRARSGVAPFSGQELVRLSAIVSDLVAIDAALSPIKIDMKNLECIQRLLAIRHGGLKLVVSAEPINTVPAAEAKE